MRRKTKIRVLEQELTRRQSSALIRRLAARHGRLPDLRTQLEDDVLLHRLRTA
jgi:hypothetical protein